MIIADDILDVKVPKDMVPTRLDSALDLYTNVSYGSQNGILLYNTSPKTWNCLYPFYELNHKFTIDTYKFHGDELTYRQLIAEYNEIYKSVYEEEQGQTRDKRVEILANEFKKTFGLSSVSVGEELSPVFELKFSKSKNVWTLYYFESYVANKVDSLKTLLEQTVYEQKVLPLVPGLTEIDGVEIGSNVQHLLSLDDTIKTLSNYLLRSQ